MQHLKVAVWLNLGTQLEYSPIKINDFENTIGNFEPYANIGGRLSYYSAKANSTHGELGIPSTTFPKYLTPSDGHSFGFSNESKAFSLSFQELEHDINKVFTRFNYRF